MRSIDICTLIAGEFIVEQRLSRCISRILSPYQNDKVAIIYLGC